MLHFFVLIAKNAKVMIWIIFVLLFLILFFLFPFFVSVCFKANVLENVGELKIKLFCFTIKAQKIVLINSSQKRISKKQKKKSFSFCLLLEIFKAIMVLKTNITFVVGNAHNAMETALCCGLMKTICSHIIVFLNNNKKCNAKYDVSADFMKTRFEFNLQLLFLIIPLSLVFAYLKFKLKRSQKWKIS